MEDLQEVDLNLESSRRPAAHPRAVGSPLPRGGAQRAVATDEGQESVPVIPPPPGRALTSGGPSATAPESSGVQRAVSAIRSAMPFVQRLLPLLDGNVATAIANIFSQQPQKPTPETEMVPVHVDLEPVQESVTELQIRTHELQKRVIEQNISIKRVEDQLQMVREATDRNTLEQQELMEDLKSIGTKVNAIAIIALILLAGSVLVNLILYFHIQRVLP